MFNALASIPKLFLISLFSFLVIFAIRQLFIKRIFFVFLYHTCFFFMLLVTAIGGGGVQNDGYDRLDKFILLEKNNQLEEAKKNPENYDPMLSIDLKQFKNAAEFKDYLQKHDASVDKAEAISIGWIFALLTEISVLLQTIILFVTGLSSKHKRPV